MPDSMAQDIDIVDSIDVDQILGLASGVLQTQPPQANAGDMMQGGMPQGFQ